MLIAICITLLDFENVGRKSFVCTQTQEHLHIIIFVVSFDKFVRFSNRIWGNNLSETADRGGNLYTLLVCPH